MSDLYPKYFPAQFFTGGHRHEGMINFMHECLRGIDHIKRTDFEIKTDNYLNNKIEFLDDCMKYIFSPDSASCCFESGQILEGEYNWEWMDELNIEPFVKGTLYLASAEDECNKYHTVTYSRKEVEGWVALCLDLVCSYLPCLKQRMFIMQVPFYDAEEAVDFIMKKLRGELAWSYGPCTPLSDEDLKQWYEVDYECLQAIEDFRHLQQSDS